MFNFIVRNKKFNSGTHIMGIINATPDSFYAASRISNDYVEKALQMVKDGAEILDIGAQSTRPEAEILEPEIELYRILPVLQSIRNADPNIPISIDTFYPEVAEMCLNYGADMINDVAYIQPMGHVAAKYNAPICVMHNRRNSMTTDLFEDKLIGIQRLIDNLKEAGVKDNNILLDAGIGFNKSTEEDIELLNNYDSIVNQFAEYPFLLGASRKSFLGGEVDNRLEGTINSSILAKKFGVLFVRVHDVKENKEWLK